MYTKHFNLIRRPFSRVPKASGCVMFPGLKSCFDRAREGIQECAGPILVVGASGCGKSTLLALLQQEFDQELSTVTLNCAAIDSRHEMIQCLLFEMGLPFQSENVGELRLKLIDHLKSPEQCPNGLLLLVDEAHNLPLEVLEELRMITNMVCGSQHQIRLVIAGGRPLEEKLAHPQLESFSQRIGARCYLQAMTRTETMFFALAQLQMCGRDGREVFQPSALEKVYDITDGVPRLVTHLCDHSLKMASQQRLFQVDSKLVNKAWLDLQQLPATPELEEFQATGPDEGIIEFGSLDEPSDHQDGVLDNAPDIENIQFDNTIDSSDNQVFEQSTQGRPKTDEEILAEFSPEPDVMPFQPADAETSHDQTYEDTDSSPTVEPTVFSEPALFSEPTDKPGVESDTSTSISGNQPAEETLEQLMNQLQNIDDASEQESRTDDDLPAIVSIEPQNAETNDETVSAPSPLTPEVAATLDEALDAANELSDEEYTRKQEERRSQKNRRDQEDRRTQTDAPTPIPISNLPASDVPILDPTVTQPLPLRSEYMKAEMDDNQQREEFGSQSNIEQSAVGETDSEDSKGDTSNDQPKEATQAVSADSLFGASYEEEPVVDVQSAILADQNRISSSMTSPELADLAPHPSADPATTTEPAIVEKSNSHPAEPQVASDDPLVQPPTPPSATTQNEFDVTMTQPIPIIDRSESLPKPTADESAEALESIVASIPTADSAGENPPTTVDRSSTMTQQWPPAPEAESNLNEQPSSTEQPTSADEGNDDDSDMLIVENLPKPETPQPAAEESPSTTSQGQVIRMNYQDLFQQLRNQNPNTPT